MPAADLSILPVSVPASESAAYLRKVAHLTGKDLPVLVTALGRYRTRDGLAVDITELKPCNAGTFRAHGHLRHPKKGKPGRFVPEWNTWQTNGRFVALGEHARDIVAVFAR